MQVVLSGFIVRLLCFVQTKLYVGMYFLTALVLVCDGDVICVDHELNMGSGWW